MLNTSLMYTLSLLYPLCPQLSSPFILLVIHISPFTFIRPFWSWSQNLALKHPLSIRREASLTEIIQENFCCLSFLNINVCLYWVWYTVWIMDYYLMSKHLKLTFFISFFIGIFALLHGQVLFSSKNLKFFASYAE